MTQAPETTSGKVTKLNRVERNAWTKRRIFDAATKIVGKFGYAEASVARITEAAGVAQGTFYNHFENRQELLDSTLSGRSRNSCAFSTKPNSSRRSATKSISTISPPPMSES